MNWLKNISKDKFISILNYISRLLFVMFKNRFILIPYILMIYSIFCYIGFGSEFLINNYTVLVCVDTALFIVSFFHFIKNNNKYSKTTYNAFLGTFYFLILEITDWKLKFSDDNYLLVYKSIIIWTIVKSIYDNLNENIKRYFTKQR